MKSVGLLLLLAMVLCHTAVAQQPSQAQVAAIKQSCRADYQSHCSNVPTGGQASLQCLQQHQADLSPNCRAAVGAIGGGGTASAGAGQAPPPSRAAPPMSGRQEASIMRNACGGDFRAYCRGVGLGGGRALGCLAANESRLSPSCKGALAEARNSR